MSAQFPLGYYTLCKYSDSACTLDESCMSLAATLTDTRRSLSGTEVSLTYYVDLDRNGYPDYGENDIYSVYALNYPCSLIQEQRSSNKSNVAGSLAITNSGWEGDIYKFEGCGTSRSVCRYSDSCTFQNCGCVSLYNGGYGKMRYDGEGIECLAYVDPDLSSSTKVSATVATLLMGSLAILNFV